MTKIEVLDHGYVELVSHMGDDEFLAQTARTSTESVGDSQKDARLVNRLVRDRHTSPIEFGQLVFDVELPIFVARQWMRHRTGAFNEFSMRYSEANDVYYVPEEERCQAQSTFNKQGSAEALENEAAARIQSTIREHSQSSYFQYQQLLQFGLTRELARMVLPVNFYTKFRWTVNLHNLMHFIKLRSDPHAQYEIRAYSDAMYSIARAHFPAAMEAFEQHVERPISISPELAKLLQNYLHADVAEGLVDFDDYDSETKAFYRKEID